MNDKVIELLDRISMTTTSIWYAVGSSIEALRSLQEQSAQLQRLELVLWLIFVQLMIVSLISLALAVEIGFLLLI